MHKVALILAALLIGACSQKESLQDKKLAIEKAEQQALAAPLDVKRHNLGGSELLVIPVVYKGDYSGLEKQMCFVWRDAEFKTASLSCPQPPEVVIEKP